MCVREFFICLEFGFFLEWHFINLYSLYLLLKYFSIVIIYGRQPKIKSHKYLLFFCVWLWLIFFMSSFFLSSYYLFVNYFLTLLSIYTIKLKSLTNIWPFLEFLHFYTSALLLKKKKTFLTQKFQLKKNK